MADQLPPFWGDESEAVAGILDWAGHRVVLPTDPKTTSRPASELQEATGRTITPEGLGWQEALRIFDEVLTQATRSQDDPMNLAYIPAAPNRTAIAFDFATSAANIFAGMWEAGAGAIHAENEALAWLVSLLDWPPTAGGCFVSGGTMGNLSALMTARERQRRELGGRPSQGWSLACTTEAHSSIRAAAVALDADLIQVPVDERGHLTVAALRQALDGQPPPFAVVASAGTTNAGLIDDLDDLADYCETRGIWLHVDGAYGGAALAAPSARHRFAGVERADSFIVDPHKWLFAPLDCCALLYRDPSMARAAHAQRAEYLDSIDREEWNPADLAIHLSRRARGLPFWFSLAGYGTDRYAAAVERTLAIARTIANGIAHEPHLQLVMVPELSVILFERIGWEQEQYRAWSQRAAADGTILCLPTRWQGRPVFRLAIINPDTSPGTVLAALETMR